MLAAAPEESLFRTCLFRGFILPVVGPWAHGASSGMTDRQEQSTYRSRSAECGPSLLPSTELLS
ncbi:hypothetical protein JMJ77_0011006 [Colletotrichum scovillei]|uniref:Uncharacterized protein n=1 Tax=Colletotrichum scovillei TaxID=1209932 RepID=A0A9P7R2X7_9PEZI|nr:hypothetical protein JMJ77_0011006 [Colletotrichum scovillei]KAG7059970.1 hypothetical protein JMJ78_0015254 [Colletotrichum scovillei]KAG7067426.1 hypothetical protein JMJ76_0008862 [Colletotrichum scovillei]